MKEGLYSFQDFKNIMKRLIADDGCPWDRVQTHESLKKYIIEECYEVIEAINNNDMENLCEELGDVLLQVVFHSYLEEKNGGFSIDEVIDGVSRKMINRHRHIFADAVANSPEEVLDSWDEIKKEEKGYKSNTEILRSIPKSLPPIIRTEKVQSKAAKSKLDVGSLSQKIDELEEDIAGLRKSINGINDNKMEIIGEILFDTINISRKLQINTAFALTNCLEKFINRFETIENTLLAVGKVIEDTDLEEISVMWNE